MAGFLRCLIYGQCLVLGTACILVAARPELWDLAWEQVQAYYAGERQLLGRVLAGSTGFMLILAVAGLFVRWWNKNRFAREVSYHTEYGQVAVSLLAIEEALSRAVENEPGVRKVAIKVREDRVRRCILISAALTLWDVDNVSDQNRRCQDILRKRFAELMPEKTAVQIEITVHRLKQRQPEKPDKPDKDRDSRAQERRRTTITDGLPPVEGERQSFTPGLSMTRGITDNGAGAALLANARERERQRRSSGTEVPPEERRRSGFAEEQHNPQPGEAEAAVQAVRRIQEVAERGITVATEPVVRSEGPGRQITASFRYDSDPSIHADTPLEASTVIPRDESNPRDQQPRAATNTVLEDGAEEFDDLYFGPTYPVIEDGQEPDYSGSPLPADQPPRNH